MNADEMQTKEFEQRASAVLGESVTRVDARVRSRLNQARHAALEEIASGRRRSFWRGPMFMPATGAVAAAAVIALMLGTHFRADRVTPVAEGGAGVDDIEMLADREGLDLVENFDGGFYEWAAGQGDDGDGTSG